MARSDWVGTYWDPSLKEAYSPCWPDVTAVTYDTGAMTNAAREAVQFLTVSAVALAFGLEAASLAGPWVGGAVRGMWLVSTASGRSRGSAISAPGCT